MDGFTVRLLRPIKWLHWALPVFPGDVGVVTGAHWTRHPDGRLLAIRFAYVCEVWVVARDVEVVK